MMKYKCDRCKIILSEDDLIKSKRKLADNYYEPIITCTCGCDDIDEVVICKDCGEETIYEDSDFYNNRCYDCFSNLAIDNLTIELANKYFDDNEDKKEDFYVKNQFRIETKSDIDSKLLQMCKNNFMNMLSSEQGMHKGGYKDTNSYGLLKDWLFYGDDYIDWYFEYIEYFKN